MNPGSPHVVLTTEDCLAVGGHYYGLRSIEKTVHMLVQEHFIGSYITNTSHGKAPFAFFPCLAYLLKRLKMISSLAKDNVPVDGSRRSGNVWLVYV